MEGRICCAYNVSRSCYVSSNVTIVDRTDQPLTIMRLLVESLGFNAATSLWLNPLHGPPQLVRPFPFDLVYLDVNRRVIEAVELLPEVPFPRFDDRATSVLILPVRTISSTGIQSNDELVVCSKEELEDRLATATALPALIAVSPASASGTSDAAAATMVADPMPSVRDAMRANTSLEAASSVPVTSVSPMPFINPQVFVPTRTSTTSHGAGFTPALSATWQVAGSATAVVPSIMEVEQEEASAENSPPLVAPSPTEAEISELGTEEPALEGSLVADEVSSVEPERIEPEKENKHDNSAIPETDTAQAVSVATPGHSGPALESAPITIDGRKRVQAGADSVADEEGPVSAEIKSNAPEAIAAPSDAPERVPIVKVSGAKPAAGVVQKATSPERKSETPRERVARAVPIAEAQELKTKLSDKKSRKHSFGDRVKEFLNCPDPPPEYRDVARLVQQGMLAQDKNDSTCSWMEVRDVSPSGCYLRTKNRWKPGNIVSLTLQRKGATEVEYESWVDVQAKVVRRDAGGVGLVWVFPEGVTFQPWHRLHTKRSDESDIQYFIREIRLAKALSFLQRISPLTTEQIRHAFIERLSNKRVSSGVEIALQAETALALDGKVSKVLAHSDVMMKIIESGSWIEDNWIRKMWSGLLVSACDADGQDTSNLPFIDLLARLTPMHLRILSFVCRRFEESVAAGASAETVDVYCSAEELTIAADSHSFARIQQTVGQLSGVGLIVESTRPSYVSVTDKEKTRTTPTTMGLKMYARCHGRR